MRRIDRTEHAYIVAYDIADPKRWRGIFRTMKGYGTRLQLSVWQCRLSDLRRTEMTMSLEELIDPDEDQLVIVDLGAAADVQLKVETLGIQDFSPIERRATII